MGILGTCAKFEERQVGAERYNLFMGCPQVRMGGREQGGWAGEEGERGQGNGTCAKFKERQVGAERCNLFMGCPQVWLGRIGG